MDFFFYTDVFWLMPLPLKSKGAKRPLTLRRYGGLNLVRNVGPALGPIWDHRIPFPSQIPWANLPAPTALRFFKRSLDTTLRLKGPAALEKSEHGWLLTYKYPIFVPHGSWSVIIHDHRHPNDVQGSKVGKIGLPSFASVSRVIPVTLVISCPRRPVKRVDRIQRFLMHSEPNILFKCHWILSHSCVSSHLKPSQRIPPIFLSSKFLELKIMSKFHTAPAKPFTAHDVKERRSWSIFATATTWRQDGFLSPHRPAFPIAPAHLPWRLDVSASPVTVMVRCRIWIIHATCKNPTIHLFNMSLYTSTYYKWHQMAVLFFHCRC